VKDKRKEFAWTTIKCFFVKKICLLNNNVDTIFSGRKGPIPIISSDFNIENLCVKKITKKKASSFIILAVSYKTLEIHTSKSSNQNTLDVSRIRVKKVLLCTHTTKSPNRNTIFIEYGILIECLSNTSKKLILNKFYDHKARCELPLQVIFLSQTIFFCLQHFWFSCTFDNILNFVLINTTIKCFFVKKNLFIE
jgi:hypothetical protein